LQYFSQVFHQELRGYVLTSLLSRVLEATILLAPVDLLLQGLDLAGYPMGSHIDSYQTLPLQDIYLVGQGSHLGEFEWSWLFTPRSLEFGKSANKGREADHGFRNRTKSRAIPVEMFSWEDQGSQREGGFEDPRPQQPFS
jgi:hypothetical protein